jgi:hypothetical protein
MIALVLVAAQESKTGDRLTHQFLIENALIEFPERNGG